MSRGESVLLPRLDGVRTRGAGQYMAKCPAHPDRSASLSVRCMDDGRTLIHCFAGCNADDVLGAVGLEFKDLFPERITDHAPPTRNRIGAGDLLRMTERELYVVAIVASDIQAKRAVSEEDWKRFAKAANALMFARSQLD